MRSQITVALGLTGMVAGVPAGCTDRSRDGWDDFGGGGTVGDGSGDASGTTGTSTTGVSGTATTGVTTTATTTSTTTATSTATATATATITDGDDGPMPACVPAGNYLEWEMILPLGADGSCECLEDCQTIALQQWNDANCCDSCWYAFGSVQCAEVLDGACHYVVTMIEDGCGKGRPLFIDERARVASAQARDDWSAIDELPSSPGQPSQTSLPSLPSLPTMDDLDPEARRWLAAHWTSAALAEHASVASFARFVLDLCALGAPPELLADASVAMQDEVRHARLAFALAGAYGERAVGPGPLPLHGLTAGLDAETIVRAAVREGCIEETLAAAEAELSAHRASDPTVRAVLARIADDEARHAVLAWRFVDWAVRRDPSLAAAVRDELRRARWAAEVEPAAREAMPLSADQASAHGILGPDLRRQLRARCLQHTVVPCVAAMLHRVSTPARPSA